MPPAPDNGRASRRRSLAPAAADIMGAVVDAASDEPGLDLLGGVQLCSYSLGDLPGPHTIVVISHGVQHANTVDFLVDPAAAAGSLRRGIVDAVGPDTRLRLVGIGRVDEDSVPPAREPCPAQSGFRGLGRRLLRVGRPMRHHQSPGLIKEATMTVPLDRPGVPTPLSVRAAADLEGHAHRGARRRRVRRQRERALRLHAVATALLRRLTVAVTELENQAHVVEEREHDASATPVPPISFRLATALLVVLALCDVVLVGSAFQRADRNLSPALALLVACGIGVALVALGKLLGTKLARARRGPTTTRPDGRCSQRSAS